MQGQGVVWPQKSDFSWPTILATHGNRGHRWSLFELIMSTILEIRTPFSYMCSARTSTHHVQIRISNGVSFMKIGMVKIPSFEYAVIVVLSRFCHEIWINKCASEIFLLSMLFTSNYTASIFSLLVVRYLHSRYKGSMKSTGKPSVDQSQSLHLPPSLMRARMSRTCHQRACGCVTCIMFSWWTFYLGFTCGYRNIDTEGLISFIHQYQQINPSCQSSRTFVFKCPCRRFWMPYYAIQSRHNAQI
jgi:hypothetical protein